MLKKNLLALGFAAISMTTTAIAADYKIDQIISASPWIHPWGLADGKCS